MSYFRGGGRIVGKGAELDWGTDWLTRSIFAQAFEVAA